LLLAIASCGEKKEGESESKPKGRFDLTTPENFVKSLCKIGDGEVDMTVIDEFYVTESAAVLQGFEEALTEDKEAFNKLIDTLKTIYADSVIVNDEGKLEFKMKEDGAEYSYSMGSSGSSILESMKSLKGDCAELVDFKEDDNGGKLTVKMSSGNESSFYLVKNDGSFKIELEKESSEALANMVFMFRNTTHLYNTTRKKLAEEKLPFKVLSKQMYDEYMEVLERTSK
jgi:hypothetical protein